MFTDWFQDYPHPLDWFDVLLNGKRITQTHNNNYANVNVRRSTSEIDALKKEPEINPEANDALGAARQETSWSARDVAPFLNRSVHGLLLRRRWT